MRTTNALLTAAAVLAPTIVRGFAPAVSSPRVATAIPASPPANDGDVSRRSALSTLLGSAAAVVGTASLLPRAAFAEAETMERGGVKLTPFNSLAFNYRGGGAPTLAAGDVDGPSISYADFLAELDADRVAFVEFLAPNGDAAYATLKRAGEEGGVEAPIRIGEGYPLEDPEGWSSPAFVIKAVAKKGVPYKFVVPGLGDSFKNM